MWVCGCVCVGIGDAWSETFFIVLCVCLQVFDRASMDQFLLKTIMPKLVYVMREFQVNPRDQQIAPLHWYVLVCAVCLL